MTGAKEDEVLTLLGCNKSPSYSFEQRREWMQRWPAPQGVHQNHVGSCRGNTGSVFLQRSVTLSSRMPRSQIMCMQAHIPGGLLSNWTHRKCHENIRSSSDALRWTVCGDRSPDRSHDTTATTAHEEHVTWVSNRVKYENMMEIHSSLTFMFWSWCFICCHFSLRTSCMSWYVHSTAYDDRWLVDGKALVMEM